MTGTRQTSGSHLRPGAGVPGIVISDDAVLAAIRVYVGEPELEYHSVDDAELDVSSAVLTAAAPHLIRDWVRTVLTLHPHVIPSMLAELADGLLPEETP